MPRFFCHLHTSSGISHDKTGGEYESLEAVYLDALHAVRDVIADYAAEGESTEGFAYEITDQDGRTLMVMPFDQRQH